MPEPLPYIARPKLESQISGFLATVLQPRQNTCKATALKGESKIGKKTIIQKTIDSNSLFKKYSCFDLDVNKFYLTDFKKGGQNKIKKALHISLELLGKIPPFYIGLISSIISGIKDELLKDGFSQKFNDYEKIIDHILFKLETNPLILIIHNNNGTNPETDAAIAHLVNISYQRDKAFAIFILSEKTVENEHVVIKNIDKFLISDEVLQEIDILPLTKGELNSTLSIVGISEECINILHQFSDGHPGRLNFVWEMLQISESSDHHKILQRKGERWEIQEYLTTLLSIDLIRESIHRLCNPPRVPKDFPFKELLIDGCLMAASMGDHFLPQAIAETLLSEDGKYSEQEIEEFDDVWYDFLEFNDDAHASLIVSTDTNETPITVESDYGCHYVYQFRDINFQIILKYAAKNLCSPSKTDNLFYNKLIKLEYWLQTYFTKNWLSALPFRIAIQRTLWNIGIANSLEKLWHNNKLLKELPSQIEAERVRVEKGYSALKLFNLLRWYAEVLQDFGYYSEGIKVLIEAKDLINEQIVDIDELQFTDFINQLGSLYYLHGEYEKAEPLLRRALEIRESQLGKDHPHVAMSLNNLAELFHSQGKYAEAESLHRRALEINETQLGKDHPSVAMSLNNLALLFKTQGKVAEAEPLVRRALEIREAQLGKDHPSVATSLNNLALLFRAQGKYAEAEPLYRRALEIRETQLGKDHPDVATSLNNLALLFYSQGKVAEAEPLYRRALEIRETQLGKDHPHVAASLNNLAALFRAQGKYTEAEPLYRRALQICEAQLGKDHPDVATSLNNLALLFLAQGKYAEAEPLYRRALEICEAQLGKDHPDVATSLNNLALLFLAQGKYAEAEPLYRRALEIRESQLGKNHPDVATSLNNLAELFRSQGKYSEAEPLVRRALEIRESQLGKDHPLVANSLNNLAALLDSQGKVTEAEPLFRRALEICETQLGKDHPLVATSLNNLAALLDSQGKVAEAEPLVRRALEIFEAKLGKKHPHTKTVRNNLEDLLETMKTSTKKDK